MRPPVLDLTWTRATLTRLGLVAHPLCQHLLRELARAQGVRLVVAQGAGDPARQERAVVSRALAQARRQRLRGAAAERYIRRQVAAWRAALL